MLPVAGLSDSGSGHEIPLAGRPWSGWGGGQAAVITPGTQRRRASAAGPRASVRGTPQHGDGPGPALRWPGVPRRVSRDGRDALLPFSLRMSPVSRAALAERAQGGAVAEEGPPRPGPRCGSSPPVQGARGTAAGCLWFPSCTLEGQGTVLHPQLPLWGPPLTAPPSLPQV